MRSDSKLARRLARALLALAMLLASAAGPALSQSPATFEDALGYYEQIRAALARDDGGPVPATALRLARAGREAAANAPSASIATGPPLQELVVAAEELGALPSSDLDALRIAFGEISRAVVTLVVADPTLARGRYIFRCPMTLGYKKWVQPSAELENPYMGSKMLRCGSETRWAR